MFRLLTHRTILWTEMEKDTDLLTTNKIKSHHNKFCLLNEDGPTVLQLGSHDPLTIGAAVSACREFPFVEMNLNCGCPSIESGGANYGASLMRRPALVKDLITAMASQTRTPVSIKCRLGVHDRIMQGADSPEDSYDELAQFIYKVTSSGCLSHVIVHARAAVLSGLSPSKNRSIPLLRPDYVYRLADDFPNLRITLNGGIRNFNDLRSYAMSAGRLDGLMAGRWLLQRPLDAWMLDSEPYIVSNEDNKSNIRRSTSITDAIKDYAGWAVSAQEEATRFELMLPLTLITEQLKEEFDDLLHGEGCTDVTHTNMITGQKNCHSYLTEKDLWCVFEAVWSAAAEIIGGKLFLGNPSVKFGDKPPFRRLDEILELGTGKKVTGKIRRNRTENT